MLLGKSCETTGPQFPAFHFLLVQSVKTGGEKLGFHCYVPSVKVLVVLRPTQTNLCDLNSEILLKIFILQSCEHHIGKLGL